MKRPIPRQSLVPGDRRKTRLQSCLEATSGADLGEASMPLAEKASKALAVQLIAPNGIRTTVYKRSGRNNTNFPSCRPAHTRCGSRSRSSFLPYRRDAVKVDGPATLDKIILQRRSETDFLPAHRGRPVPAHRCGVDLELAGHGRREADIQPQLWSRVAIPTSRS